MDGHHIRRTIGFGNGLFVDILHWVVGLTYVQLRGASSSHFITFLIATTSCHTIVYCHTCVVQQIRRGNGSIYDTVGLHSIHGYLTLNARATLPHETRGTFYNFGLRRQVVLVEAGHIFKGFGVPIWVNKRKGDRGTYHLYTHLSFWTTRFNVRIGVFTQDNFYGDLFRRRVNVYNNHVGLTYGHLGFRVHFQVVFCVFTTFVVGDTTRPDWGLVVYWTRGSVFAILSFPLTVDIVLCTFSVFSTTTAGAPSTSLDTSPTERTTSLSSRKFTTVPCSNSKWGRPFFRFGVLFTFSGTSSSSTRTTLI